MSYRNSTCAHSMCAFPMTRACSRTLSRWPSSGSRPRARRTLRRGRRARMRRPHRNPPVPKASSDVSSVVFHPGPHRPRAMQQHQPQPQRRLCRRTAHRRAPVQQPIRTTRPGSRNDGRSGGRCGCCGRAANEYRVDWRCLRDRCTARRGWIVRASVRTVRCLAHGGPATGAPGAVAQAAQHAVLGRRTQS